MMHIQLKKFIFNPLKVNTYLLWDQAGHCIVIDPGCHTVAEQRSLSEFIITLNIKPIAILLTHEHVDHIAGTRYVSNTYGIDIYIHEKEEINQSKTEYNAHLHKVNLGGSNLSAAKTFSGGQQISFGGISLNIIHVPGHTMGSVCFFEPSKHWLFAGDTLTKGSLGYSYDGYQQLMQILKREVLSLPEDTLFFYGHGSDSSMAIEKKNNVFFQRMMKNH